MSRLVDLLLSIEDAFGIDFETVRLEAVETLGDLHAVIVTHLSESTAPYESTRRFREFRRALEEVAPSPIRVRPSTEFETAIPARDRREVWRELARRTTFRLPRLTLPVPRGSATLLLVMLAVSLALPGSGPVVGAGLLLTCAALVGLWRLDLGTRAPIGCRTLRDVIYGSLAEDPPRPAGIQRAEAWGTLRALVAPYSRTPVDRLDPRSRVLEVIPD